MIKTINKKGISLIVISIVLVILVLLSGLVIYMGNDIILTSKNTVYARDLEKITEAVSEYYAVNGSLPILKENGKEMKAEKYKSDIKELLGEDKLAILEFEIKENNDEEAIFYEIDISKIGIDDIKYGVKENEHDLFLVSSESHVIYYYIGYENRTGVYFSNTQIIRK